MDRLQFNASASINGVYNKYIKRILDILCSGAALIVLSPVILLFSVLGAICMKGNPFFIQRRPGKDEKVFKLIKFRTMSKAKDVHDNMLPDSQRVNEYGKFLRSTSIDELPELLNILKGDMSIIGPRPLSVMYLPYYTEEEKHRHDVRPGLSGLAQVNGRNSTTWEQRFYYDLEYVRSISFLLDAWILLLTITKVIRRENIGNRQESAGGGGLIDFDVYRSKCREDKQ